MQDEDKEPKKPVSPEKLAANRKNAQRSTGPRTSAGKRRAAENSYRHGFFAVRLFPTDEVRAQDAENYDRILLGYRNHYMPVGDIENLLVEKIAVESLRLARLLGHEQDVMQTCRWPFETRSVDRLARYESNVTRQLEKTIVQLERLQAQRKAQTDEPEPSDLNEGSNSEQQAEQQPEING